MTSTRRVAFTLILALFAGAAASCAPPKAPASAHHAGARCSGATISPPTLNDAAPRDYPGIHNAVAFHEGFISGGAPEGDAGFDSLAAMGVKTIISVDGAEPEVDPAQARSIRYIHLPIGYNGFDEQRRLELVRATRDAMNVGPVYIHCHHGKHRSAGAAAAVASSMGWMSPEQGVERMNISGTAPNYTGLYACASNATVIDATVIDRVPANFPSVARPSGFVQGMVQIDEAFDQLRAIEQAGWAVPADHPDLVPVAEAGRLADLFRTLAQSQYAKHKPAQLAEMMRDANAGAQTLEDLLAASEQDGAKLSAQLKLVAGSCKSCHAKHRD